MYVIKCKFCGNDFSVKYKSWALKRKFCSGSCAAKGNPLKHCIPHTEEAKEKMRKNYSEKSGRTQFKKGHEFFRGGEKGWFKKGCKPWNYRGGVRSLSQMLKDDSRYVVWRKAVFERDDYTCQECNLKGCYLEAHHIKAKATHPELAFDVDNGITLCKDCHIKTDNYGGKKQ